MSDHIPAMEDHTLAPTGEPANPSDIRRSARFGYLLPFLAFLGLATALGYGLTRDPSLLPSTFIGKDVPQFSLPPVKGRDLGLSSDDLGGEVSLVNVFASWCAACRYEHPLFMRIKEEGIVPIHGIDYKDQPDDAAAWLDQLGDPYTRTGADIDGRAGIELGVYGVPETFVINRDGQIVYKHIGAITPQFLEETLIPMIEELQRQ